MTHPPSLGSRVYFKRRSDHATLSGIVTRTLPGSSIVLVYDQFGKTRTIKVKNLVPAPAPPPPVLVQPTQEHTREEPTQNR